MSCGRLLENLCQWPNMEMSKCVTGMELPGDMAWSSRNAFPPCHVPWPYIPTGCAGAILIRLVLTLRSPDSQDQLDIGRTPRILAVTGCHTFPWSYKGQAVVIGWQLSNGCHPIAAALPSPGSGAFLGHTFPWSYRALRCAGAILIRLVPARYQKNSQNLGCGDFPWSYRGQAEVIGLQPFDEWLQSFSFSLAFESLCDLTRTAATDCRDQWQLFLATLCEWYLFFWRHLLGHTLLHMGRTNSQTQVIQ